MYQYKIRALNNALQLEKILNEEAAKGWRLKEVANIYLIFEREVTEEGKTNG